MPTFVWKPGACMFWGIFCAYTTFIREAQGPFKWDTLSLDSVGKEAGALSAGPFTIPSPCFCRPVNERPPPLSFLIQWLAFVLWAEYLAYETAQLALLLFTSASHTCAVCQIWTQNIWMSFRLPVPSLPTLYKINPLLCENKDEFGLLFSGCLWVYLWTSPYSPMPPPNKRIKPNDQKKCLL